MGKSIAEKCKHDFKDKNVFQLYDKNGNLVYFERKSYDWNFFEFNDTGVLTFNLNSDTIKVCPKMIQLASISGHDLEKDGSLRYYDKDKNLLYMESLRTVRIELGIDENGYSYCEESTRDGWTIWDYNKDGLCRQIENDTEGNNTLIIDFDGSWKRFRYDNKNRLLETIASDGSQYLYRYTSEEKFFLTTNYLDGEWVRFFGSESGLGVKSVSSDDVQY